MTEHDTKAAPLFTPLDELDMLEMHFQGLLEGYANKMEWFEIAARTDNVLASFKSLRHALGSAAQETELVEALEEIAREGDVTKGGLGCKRIAEAALAKYRAAPKEENGK